MTTIGLVADDQSLEVAVNPIITSGEENTVTLHVDFSEDWNGFGKTAVFFTEKNKNTLYEKVMTSGECIVPSEVMVNEGTFLVGIRGVNSTSKQVKTTSLVKYKISKGTPAVVEFGPTPDVYEQLLTSYGILDSAVSNLNSDIEFERARIDNLSTLKEGSTTADAELIDIRIKADGTTATSAGNAVREQITELKSDLIESVGQINKQYIDKDTFNNGYWWGYDSATHNYGLNENQYFDCLQVQNIKAGQYKLSKNDGLYNAFAVNILTNKAYPITDYRVRELETDKYFVLNVPFDFNFLLTVESYKRHDYMLCDNEFPNSYVYGVFGLNLTDTALEKTLENYNKNNIFYCGSSREFTTLKSAIEEATKYMDSIVYVDNGTYDLVSEFGTTYLDSYTGTDNIGLLLKNRVHVIFSSGAKVVFDYQGTNEKVHEYFSPFNSGEYGFTLENAYVDSKNCRYSVHDERAHATDSYHNVYKRCTFLHDSSKASGWHASQAIGGGLGKYGDILIEDCYCKSVSNDDTISYHSTTISEEGNNAKSKIVVKDTYTTGTLCFIPLGNSTEKTDIKVSGCNLRIEPKISGSAETMNLLSWGNTIRSPQG